jgi:rRNA small subunit aminocarboxypropyltransferase
MPSSANTRNLPDNAEIPLFVLITGEDHPKACTARRLVGQRLVVRVGPHVARTRGAVLLDPFATIPLSAADRPAARLHGLAVVDCSWNQLGDRGGFSRPWDGAFPRARRRRLPWLTATNPQHYGRLGELTTAESFAAGLELLGEHDRALDLLSRFHGADAFFEVNRTEFKNYRAATDSDGVRSAERHRFAPQDSGTHQGSS